MELRHIRYFIAVAEEENVSRAALKVHVSQPALSRQVRDLEEELGFRLLDRGAKSVRLTEAGRVFLEEARALIERVREGVAKARAAAVGKGELQLGYAPSPTVEILPRALRAFQAQLPGVRVRLHDLSAEEMVSQLHAGKLDVALTVKPCPGSLRGLEFVELAQYLLCVAVHPQHRWARARALSLEELRTEPLLGYTRQDYPDYHEQVGALFQTIDYTPKFVEEHDSVTSLIAGVESGRGAAVVPSCLGCMAGPRLRLIPLKPAGAPLIVGVLRQAKASAPAVEFTQATLSISQS